MLAESVTHNPLPSESFLWWEQRRLRYNIGPIIAGGLAFAAYVLVIIHFQDVIDAAEPSQADELSGFTLVFQGFGYLFMMLVANVCFFLEPLSEWLLRPRNVGRYRKIAFRLGFWGSVALPFGMPTFLLFVATFYPGYFQWASAAH
jgi:hypothetical protein